VTSWVPSTRADRIRWGAVVALAIIALAIPPVASWYEDFTMGDFSSKFAIFLGESALVFALWAVSYNLMLGYVGMVSFAHAAYFGIGAYVVALGSKHFHLPVLEALVLTPFIGAAFGLVSGVIALRAVRLYFSLLTLAISQVLFAIAYQWYSFTGGDNGVHGLDIPDAISGYAPQYFFVLAVSAVCLLAMFLLVRSPWGAALLAIRENRERARSVGINVKNYEVSVYTVASAFAAVAGGLFAIVNQYAQPEMLYWTQNATPVVITLLGGLGSFLGPAVGAFIYVILQQFITTNNSLKQYFDIALGVIVLGIVLAAPGGFASMPDLAVRFYRRLRPSRVPLEEVLAVESEGEALRHIDVGKAVHSQAIGTAEIHGKGEVLLRVEELSKRFGGLRAVEGVHLEVRQGSRHAIIGPNGAGKSTLFNLITGRIHPSAGRVWFDGREITNRPPHVIARAGIGRAFQITSIFPKLTVRQNLQYAMLANRGYTARPFGFADQIFREEAQELLDAVGLGRYADLPAGQLSHGDQRAIELAISLALGSKMILLDEPTAGMSAYETQKAMELVRQIASQRHITLLFCEHDMEVVFGTATTVTVMHQGRVLVEGTPEAIRANDEVQKVYLGELEWDEPTPEEAPA
jgi:ABC-type branched-subunit amino acid transport system ATPase component/ABC-type branched-subunit amino acid transport system permease subunit